VIEQRKYWRQDLLKFSYALEKHYRQKSVGRTVARVSAEEHMANYQAARALMGKGRNAGEGATGLSKSRAKKGIKKSAVKKTKPKK
jgi:hypothetical protein